MDILSQIITLSIKIDTSKTNNLDSYNNNIDEKIEQFSSLQNHIHVKSLSNIVSTNNNWYVNFNSMRNLVTHWSDLINFKPLTHGASVDSTTARIYYPKMPDGKKVTTYMNELWVNMTTLIKDLGVIVKEISEDER